MLSGGIPIGRFFGISIRLHYSWFIIFVLITWALAGSYFPSVYPDWGSFAYLAVGFATSILFFLSVLVHELAHSLVAKREGIPVESITLFVLGGVAKIEREPDKPSTEFQVAIAGPVTSLVISGIFWIIWATVRGSSEPGTALAFWLGWTNAILAAFNLIPGFPLDGGRVLRAIAWWRTGNFKSATRTATNIGRVVGYLLIFGGIWWVFWGSWINGLWLAFIGWFLQSAAAGAYRQVAIMDMIRGHTVREVMTKDCATVPPDISIEELVHGYILHSGRRCFPVTKDGHVLGLITVQDVSKVPRELRPQKSVAEAMTPLDKVKWVKPGDDLSGVLEVLTKEDINQLPVVDNGTVVGLVARDNLLSFISVRAELER